MEKYYKLLPSVDMKVMGVSIQSQKHLPNEGWMYGNSDSYMTIAGEGKINYEPTFPIFGLEKKAKVTDFIFGVNTGTNWLLINQRFLDVLKKFNIDEYQVFNVKVKTKTEELLDYFMLFINYGRDKNYVNWEKTKFRHTTQFWQKDIKALTFQDFEAFKKLNLELYLLKEDIALESLHLKNSEISTDIFRLCGVERGFFVSERVKNELESKKITGIQFIETTELRQPMRKFS